MSLTVSKLKRWNQLYLFGNLERNKHGKEIPWKHSNFQSVAPFRKNQVRLEYCNYRWLDRCWKPFPSRCPFLTKTTLQALQLCNFKITATSSDCRSQLPKITCWARKVHPRYQSWSHMSSSSLLGRSATGVQRWENLGCGDRRTALYHTSVSSSP